MNAGKLVAQVAVVAIVVYCCYGAIVEALPTNANDLQDLVKNPVSVSQPEVSAGIDGASLNVTISTDITSHFPQDIDGVYMKIFLGEKAIKVKFGQITIGTLEPNVAKHFEETISIPLYLVASYAICSADGDGMKLPLCTEVGFKYFKWQGDYLVDLGITMKYDVDISGATVIAPTIYNDGQDAKMEVSVDTTGEGNILKTALEYLDTSGMMDSGKITLTCGDAEFVITPVDNGSTVDVLFDVHGADGKTAVDIIKQVVAENDGVLQFECAAYSGTIPPVTDENVDTFISIISTLYAGASA